MISFRTNAKNFPDAERKYNHLYEIILKLMIRSHVELCMSP